MKTVIVDYHDAGKLGYIELDPPKEPVIILGASYNESADGETANVAISYRRPDKND